MALERRPPVTIDWLRWPRKNPLTPETLRPHVTSNWARIDFLRTLQREPRKGVAITPTMARNQARLLNFLLLSGAATVEQQRGGRILVKLTEGAAQPGAFSRVLAEVRGMRKWIGRQPPARPRHLTYMELEKAFAALAKAAGMGKVFERLLREPGTIHDLSPAAYRSVAEPLAALQVRGLLKVYPAGKPGTIGIQVTKSGQVDEMVKSLATGIPPGWGKRDRQPPSY